MKDVVLDELIEEDKKKKKFQSKHKRDVHFLLTQDRNPQKGNKLIKRPFASRDGDRNENKQFNKKRFGKGRDENNPKKLKKFNKNREDR